MGVQTHRRTARRRGFTIVELLIVIAIIALLISIALPSFRRAREQAKEVATQSTITSISSSLELYRGEQALGTRYPPSQSDDPSGEIQDPFDDSGPVRVTGASLLVLALAGPDQQGTAGFSGVGGSLWSSTTGGPGAGGVYDTTLSNNAPRYGPYAEGKLLESIQPIEAFDRSGNSIGIRKQGIVKQSDMTGHEEEQRFFVDEFKRPILYYRARSAAKRMITVPNSFAGVYDHRDNAMLTGGSIHGSGGRTGVLFASRPLIDDSGNPHNHRIDTTQYQTNPNDLSLPASFGQAPSLKENNPLPFDAYIIDLKSSVAVPRPVNPSTFLLVSAGADGYYGTKDDVKNWGN